MMKRCLNSDNISSGQKQQRKQSTGTVQRRTSASIEAKYTTYSLKSIVVLLLALIHCGQGAKFVQSAELWDMMQATQPQQQQCHALQPEDMATDDKLVLAPIIFQGRLISRSNVYNSLYFTSLRVLKVLKGSVPKRLHRHMRLLFHTSYPSDKHQQHHQRSRHPCLPVSFDVKMGRKYVIYVKKIGVGRYAAIAQPDVFNKKTRRAARKLLCPNCVSSPKVSGMSRQHTVSQGGKLKMKCKVSGSPKPRIMWLKNDRPLHQDIRISIKTKRRRSILRLSDAQGRDAGKYTCRAINVLGEHSQTTSISVRVIAPDPPASNCPIDSFCLNGGKCLFYEMIGELVCRCPEGFAGQRCQFKKARINLPFFENEACGPYGHDIHLREICAAWKQPPVAEMTREEYESWKRVEKEVAELKRKLELEEMHKFRQMSRPKFSNISTTIVNDHDTTTTLQHQHDKHKQKNNVFISDDHKKNYNKNKKINEEDERFLDYTSSSNEE